MKCGRKCLAGCFGLFVSVFVSSRLSSYGSKIHHCFLLVLQGYMYLTNSHLCFFAHMPAREVCCSFISQKNLYLDQRNVQDQILKSGTLNKKAQRTKRWIKHWFVLKNDALSWYQSSSVGFTPAYG